MTVLLCLPKTVVQGLNHCERMLTLLPSLRSRNEELLAEARERCKALSQRRMPAVDMFVPIWMEPLMTVHGDTFISDVVELIGGRNVFADRPRRYPLSADLGQRKPLPPERVKERDTRYPRVTLQEVSERQPQLVLLPDEPHEFTPKDATVFEQLDIPASRHGSIHFCDGRQLMWYGLRALSGLSTLTALVDATREQHAR